jgi:transposase
MRKLYRRVAGLDVHKDQVTACVRIARKGEDPFEEIREFGTTTAQLLVLRDWLAAHEITLVSMEATGVYWKPIYYVLEDEFETWVVNARHFHNVPGKKTDDNDARWLAELTQHGLVRPSFIPPRDIRELRDLTRYRKTQIQARTAEAQRLDKILQDAGIKLSSVASRVLGVSSRAMLDAMVEGTTDPEVLAELAQGRLRAKLPALKEALQGRFSRRHALLVGQILAHIDYLDEAIENLSRDVEEAVRPFEEKIELLKTIPGVDERTAQSLIAECGPDMSRFLTHKHLASWAGMCPGNNESAGKRHSGRARKGSKWLRDTLVQAAHAAEKAKGTYLASQYARLRGRRGSRRAAMAVGHSILVCAYHVLKNGVPYQELGEDWLLRRDTERQTRRLVAQLTKLGNIVTLTPVEVAPA